MSRMSVLNKGSMKGHPSSRLLKWAVQWGMFPNIFPPFQPKGGAMNKLYGGIDLHANNSVVVVLDEQDHVVFHKRLPNEFATILRQLAPFRTHLQGLVVESTYNWY